MDGSATRLNGPARRSEAVGAYYQDWANRPERVRQQSRAEAFAALAARYPADDEAQIFSALYLAGTQSLTDQTYEILEKQFAKHPITRAWRIT